MLLDVVLCNLTPKGAMSQVFDMEEACVYLKLAKPTIYKYVRLGEIPAFKMGRVWRFPKEMLDAWMRERVTEDTIARTKKSNRN